MDLIGNRQIDFFSSSEGCFTRVRVVDDDLLSVHLNCVFCQRAHAHPDLHLSLEGVIDPLDPAYTVGLRGTFRSN